VIIAIMLLMVVAAYSRLVAIETAEEAVGPTAFPGLLQLDDPQRLGRQLRHQPATGGPVNHREITSADMELFKSFEDRLKQHMASYGPPSGPR
jgi:methyl-accepting chemotaxis protein WspA